MRLSEDEILHLTDETKKRQANAAHQIRNLKLGWISINQVQ